MILSTRIVPEGQFSDAPRVTMVAQARRQDIEASLQWWAANTATDEMTEEMRTRFPEHFEQWRGRAETLAAELAAMDRQQQEADMNQNQKRLAMDDPITEQPPGPGFWLRVRRQIKTNGKVYDPGNDFPVALFNRALLAGRFIEWTAPTIRPTGGPRDLSPPTPTRPSNPVVETVTVPGDIEASAATTLALMTKKCAALAPWMSEGEARKWAEDLIAQDHAASDISTRGEAARQLRVRRERGVLSL